MLRYLTPEYWSYFDGMYYEKDKNITTAFTELQQDDLFALEDRSWWFQYRGTLLLKILKKYFCKDLDLVDIGAGNGYNSMRAQEDGYSVTVMEPSTTACVNAVKRGVNQVVCGGVEEETVPDSSIPQFMMCDVLEHIEDDKGFATLLFKKLVPGGLGLVTVPAFMQLWSSEDESAGHFRRYTIAQVTGVLENAGFEIVEKNYFMSFLYLPILIIRVWMEKLGILKRTDARSQEEKNKIADKQFKQRGGIINFVLESFEKHEIKKIESQASIKRGSSIYVVVRKR